MCRYLTDLRKVEQSPDGRYVRVSQEGRRTWSGRRERRNAAGDHRCQAEREAHMREVNAQWAAIQARPEPTDEECK